MPTIGNVYAWGASQRSGIPEKPVSEYSEGKVDYGPEVAEIEALRGQHVLKLCAERAQVAVLAEGRRLHWVTEAPPKSEEVQKVALEMEAESLEFGAGHLAMLSADGSVFTWGEGAEGQLGHGHALPSTEPELVTAMQDKVIKQVATGDAHTAVVTDVGELYTWGRSYEGQTGHGFKSSKAADIAQSDGEVQIKPKFVPALLRNPVKLVSCGTRFTVIVNTKGQLYSWGEGLAGQLGVGRVTKRNTPSLVLESGDGHPFVDISCGWGHTLALTDDGQVFVWGFNASGQLGLGDAFPRYFPERLEEQDLDSNTKKREAEKEARREASRIRHEEERRKAREEAAALAASKSAPSLEVLAAKPSGGAGGFGGPGGTNILSINVDSGSEEPSPLPSVRTSSPPRRLERGASAADLSKTSWLMQSVQQSLKISEADAAEESGRMVRSKSGYSSRKQPLTPLTQPPPRPDWFLPDKIFRATKVSAGGHHSAAVTSKGELYVWGASGDGRLGLPHAQVHQEIENGDVTTERRLSMLYPVRVKALDGRVIADVACADKDTIVVASVELHDVEPKCGSTVGGARLHLSGGGLEALAWRDHAAARAFEEGAPDGDERIPGVFVRFTRHSRVPPLEEGEDEADMEEPPPEMLEKVCTQPALRALAGDGLDVVSPAGFPTECEVQIEVIIGEDEVVAGSAIFNYYVNPIVEMVTPDALPMEAGTRFELEAAGLFGCMMADSGSRESAKQLVQRVETEFEANEDAKEAAEDAAAARAAAIASGDMDEDEAGSADGSAIGEPQSHYLEPVDAAATKVRFTLFCNGAPTDCVSTVPAQYAASYVLPDPAEAADKKKAEMADDASQVSGVDEEEEEDEGPPGTFGAKLIFTSPDFELTPDVVAARAAGECQLQIQLALAPNGIDWVDCPQLLTTFAPEFTGVAPAAVPMVGDAIVKVHGNGFVKLDTAAVRVFARDVSAPMEERKTWTAQAVVLDSRLLEFKLPKLELPARSERKDADGSDIEGDGATDGPPAAGNARYGMDVTFDGLHYHSADCLGFTGYKGTFGMLKPSCGVLGGGTTVKVYGSEDQPKFVFASDKTRVRTVGERFNTEIEAKASAKRNLVQFESPAFTPSPPTEVEGKDADDEGKDGGEGDEGKEGEAKADGEEGEAEAPPPPNRTVAVSLTLNGEAWEAYEGSFTYYDPEDVAVSSVEPEGAKKVTAACRILVHATGLAFADDRVLKVVLSCTEPDDDGDILSKSLTLPQVEFNEEKTALALNLPEEFQAGMNVGVELSIDGQHMTSSGVTFAIS